MNENDILESCLEVLKQGASLASCMKNYSELSNESLQILRAAVRLHTAGEHLTPTSDFKHRARGNLMRRIAAEQRRGMAAAPAWDISLRQRWQAFWASLLSPKMQWQPSAAIIALVLFLALGAGVVTAAQKAEPGDLLYPIRRLTAQAGAVLRRDEETPSIPKTPAVTPTPTLQHGQPAATISATPQTPAGSVPSPIPTLEQPTRTIVPNTPVPPTALPTATLPATPTLAPIVPPLPTRTSMPGSPSPTSPPTIAPTLAPTMSPTTAPTIAPTRLPPTATIAPPTATAPSPTVTIAPPTATAPPPTATIAPPTATAPPPTATAAPPTATPRPTMAPPTATPVPTIAPTQPAPTPPSWP